MDVLQHVLMLPDMRLHVLSLVLRINGHTRSMVLAAQAKCYLWVQEISSMQAGMAALMGTASNAVLDSYADSLHDGARAVVEEGVVAAAPTVVALAEQQW